MTKTATEQVKKDIRSGITKLLFVAPESLGEGRNASILKQSKISFLAVDEAHCISEWGHDFRPDYRNLRHMLQQIDQDLPVIALTATATPKVQEEIMKKPGKLQRLKFLSLPLIALTFIMRFVQKRAK